MLGIPVENRVTGTGMLRICRNYLRMVHSDQNCFTSLGEDAAPLVVLNRCIFRMKGYASRDFEWDVYRCDWQ